MVAIVLISIKIPNFLFIYSNRVTRIYFNVVIFIRVFEMVLSVIGVRKPIYFFWHSTCISFCSTYFVLYCVRIFVNLFVSYGIHSFYLFVDYEVLYFSNKNKSFEITLMTNFCEVILVDDEDEDPFVAYSVAIENPCRLTIYHCCLIFDDFSLIVSVYFIGSCFKGKLIDLWKEEVFLDFSKSYYFCGQRVMKEVHTLLISLIRWVYVIYNRVDLHFMVY